MDGVLHRDGDPRQRALEIHLILQPGLRFGKQQLRNTVSTLLRLDSNLAVSLEHTQRRGRRVLDITDQLVDRLVENLLIICREMKVIMIREGTEAGGAFRLFLVPDSVSKVY